MQPHEKSVNPSVDCLLVSNKFYQNLCVLISTNGSRLLSVNLRVLILEHIEKLVDFVTYENKSVSPNYLFFCYIFFVF